MAPGTWTRSAAGTQTQLHLPHVKDNSRGCIRFVRPLFMLGAALALQFQPQLPLDYVLSKGGASPDCHSTPRPGMSEALPRIPGRSARRERAGARSERFPYLNRKRVKTRRCDEEEEGARCTDRKHTEKWLRSQTGAQWWWRQRRGGSEGAKGPPSSGGYAARSDGENPTDGIKEEKLSRLSDTEPYTCFKRRRLVYTTHGNLLLQLSAFSRFKGSAWAQRAVHCSL
ncbi:unnamed protein product [Pleuronectes platessa]|uniref:Uncharacterized protein n=1 Tax=Pleuronectes platessa TaxID=8262 RepID=A0A9N7ZDL8_PLEPL|nr:unnamed protein product [Pleuronectes platessa]